MKQKIHPAWIVTGIGPVISISFPRLFAFFSGLGTGIGASLSADCHLGWSATSIRSHKIHPLYSYSLAVNPDQRLGPGPIRRSIHPQSHGAGGSIRWRQLRVALLSGIFDRLWREIADFSLAYLVTRCPWRGERTGINVAGWCAFEDGGLCPAAI